MVIQKGIPVDVEREQSPHEDLGFTRHVKETKAPLPNLPEDKKRGLEICGAILDSLKTRRSSVEKKKEELTPPLPDKSP